MHVGIDLGGTTISAAAVNRRGRTLAVRHRRTPRGDYAATVTAVCEMVHDLEAACERKAWVGVGIPGAISPATGVVKNANSTWLIGRPLDADLAAALDRPVRVANDATCFAVSESSDGAAAGESPVFGVILGTGVGGGIVVDGRPIAGANAIAGEWGHNPLPRPADAERPGPRCYCGRDGCIETFLSGPALARTYDASGATPAPTVVERARSGEAAAANALAVHAERLARALGSVVNVLDPAVLVLGGGVGGIPGLAEDVAARLPPHAFTDTLATRICRPAHGPASGMFGAARLWPLDAPEPPP